MIKKLGIGILLSLPLLLAMGYYFLASSEATYNVQGKIIGFSDDSTTIFIEHEEIPNFMPSMSMPFTLQNKNELGTFQTGDPISFLLNVNDTDSWISNLQRISLDELDLPDTSFMANHDLSPSDPIQVGEFVSPIPLENQYGEPFDLTTFQGKTVLLTFIYTRCPLPDLCPRMSNNFALMQKKLSHTNLANEIQLVSISFDPAFDTPQTLTKYATRYTNDTTNWTFATGTPEAIQHIATQFGVFLEKESETTINHTLATALIDAKGMVIKIWRGNDWEVEDVFELAKQTAEQKNSHTTSK